MTLTPSSSTGAASGGSQTLISTTTLGANGTFDLQNIAQTYNALMLVLIGRGTDAGANDRVVIRFNNDSAANYDDQTVEGAAAAAVASRHAATATPEIVDAIPAAGGAANAFGMAQILIPGYASTLWQKVAYSTFYTVGAAGAPAVGMTGVQWRSTAAINRVGLFCQTTANLLTGSVVYLYGVT